MSVVYAVLTAVWIGEMLRLRQHVLPVHFLCLVCVLVKAVQSILIAVYYHRQVKNTEYARMRTGFRESTPPRFVCLVCICSLLHSRWRAGTTAASRAQTAPRHVFVLPWIETRRSGVCAMSPALSLTSNTPLLFTLSHITQYIKTNLPLLLCYALHCLSRAVALFVHTRHPRMCACVERGG